MGRLSRRLQPVLCQPEWEALAEPDAGADIRHCAGSLWGQIEGARGHAQAVRSARPVAERLLPPTAFIARLLRIRDAKAAAFVWLSSDIGASIRSASYARRDEQDRKGEFNE